MVRSLHNLRKFFGLALLLTACTLSVATSSENDYPYDDEVVPEDEGAGPDGDEQMLLQDQMAPAPAEAPVEDTPRGAPAPDETAVI